MAQKNLKDEIAIAAMHSLHRHGYNATSVQDITNAAGAPKGSFYNHFASKEMIAVEALQRYWEMALPSIEALADPGIAPLVRLEKYFEGLHAFAKSHKSQPGCMIGNFAGELSNQSSVVREKVSDLFAQWTASLAVCIRAGQADGTIRVDLSAEDLASFLLNSWEGAGLRAKADKNDRPFIVFAMTALPLLTA